MKIVAACFLAALTGSVFAQAEPAIPILMQCELQQCAPGGRGGVWTFKGRQGLATWATGAAAYLEVERFEPSNVVIHRRDLPASAGFGVIASATYTGTIRGTMLEGTVAWTTTDGKRDRGPFKARFHAPEQYAFAQQQAGSMFGRQFARDPNVLGLDPKKTCTDELASHADVDYAWLLGQVALGVKAGQTMWQGAQVVDLAPPPTDTVDNFRRAACWFASAAVQKHPGAQAALAVLLHEGRGIAKDDRMAYQWALASGLKNDPAGKQVLAKFEAEGLQRTLPATPAVRDEDVMIAAVPMRLNQCQTIDARTMCGPWAWDGGTYIAIWVSEGKKRNVRVHRWDDEGILMVHEEWAEGANKADGAKPLITITYRGARLPDGTYGGRALGDWPGQFPNSPLGPGKFEMPWWAGVSTQTVPHAACSLENPPTVTPGQNLREFSRTALASGDLQAGHCWSFVCAMRGVAECQTSYALDLITGHGTRKDPKEALRWMLIAAQQGSWHAMGNLYKMYLEGVGTPVDLKQAEFWRRRADAAAKYTPENRNYVATASAEDQADICSRRPRDAEVIGINCKWAIPQAELNAQIAEEEDRRDRLRDKLCGSAPSESRQQGWTGSFRQKNFQRCQNDAYSDDEWHRNQQEYYRRSRDLAR